MGVDRGQEKGGKEKTDTTGAQEGGVSSGVSVLFCKGGGESHQGGQKRGQDTLIPGFCGRSA